jgi:hypothetical protein
MADQGYGVAVDGAGNIAITGYFPGNRGVLRRHQPRERGQTATFFVANVRRRTATHPF